MLDAATTVRISFLQWLLRQDDDRRQWYGAFREYYDGIHDTQLSSRQRAFLEVKLNEEFNLNYCAVVVDALAERLNVTGFTTSAVVETIGDDGKPQTRDFMAETMWQWWQANRMDAAQGVAHTAGIRDGDAYVITEWDDDNKRPRWSVEQAFDGADGVEIRYSSERRQEPAYAIKYWRIEGDNPTSAGYVRRMNVYYPDRVEKYISDQRNKSGDWSLIETSAWVDADGQPLGIPVAHFRNRDQGYNYGQSELVNVIPPQNALNKTVIDLIASADTSGFRIMYMLGDDPSSLSVAPGAIVYSAKPPNMVTFGALEGSNPAPLIDLKDSFAIDIARVSRTPLSYFQISGQRAAEGTLKQEEQGLVSKARKCQVDFGNAWEDAMRMGVKLAVTYGNGAGLDPKAMISTVWNEPQTRDELALMQQLQIKRQALQVPVDVLWGEAGYSPTAIAEMKGSEEYMQRVELMKSGLNALTRQNEINEPGQEDEEDEQPQRGRPFGRTNE